MRQKGVIVKSVILAASFLGTVASASVGVSATATGCDQQVRTWAEATAESFGGVVSSTEFKPIALSEAEALLLTMQNELDDQELAIALEIIRLKEHLIYNVEYEGSSSGPGSGADLVVVDSRTCAVAYRIPYFSE